jgi:hypothetical protein
MRMCQPHWEKLKQKIEERGISRLVSKSGEVVAGKIAKEIESGAGTKETFDPLMSAHNAIVSNAMDTAGLEIMMPNEDGSDRCPICFLQQSCKCGAPDCKERYEQWVEFAARDAFERAKSLGLVNEA